MNRNAADPEGIVIVDHLKRIIPEPPEKVRGGLLPFLAWQRGYTDAAAGNPLASGYKLGVWKYYYRLGYNAHAADRRAALRRCATGTPSDG